MLPSSSNQKFGVNRFNQSIPPKPPTSPIPSYRDDHKAEPSVMASSTSYSVNLSNTPRCTNRSGSALFAGPYSYFSIKSSGVAKLSSSPSESFARNDVTQAKTLENQNCAGNSDINGHPEMRNTSKFPESVRETSETSVAGRYDDNGFQENLPGTLMPPSDSSNIIKPLKDLEAGNSDLQRQALSSENSDLNTVNESASTLSTDEVNVSNQTTVSRGHICSSSRWMSAEKALNMANPDGVKKSITVSPSRDFCSDSRLSENSESLSGSEPNNLKGLKQTVSSNVFLPCSHSGSVEEASDEGNLEQPGKPSISSGNYAISHFRSDERGRGRLNSTTLAHLNEEHSFLEDHHDNSHLSVTDKRIRLKNSFISRHSDHFFDSKEEHLSNFARDAGEALSAVSLSEQSGLTEEHVFPEGCSQGINLPSPEVSGSMGPKCPEELSHFCNSESFYSSNPSHNIREKSNQFEPEESSQDYFNEQKHVANLNPYDKDRTVDISETNDLEEMNRLFNGRETCSTAPRNSKISLNGSTEVNPRKFSTNSEHYMSGTNRNDCSKDRYSKYSQLRYLNSVTNTLNLNTVDGSGLSTGESRHTTLRDSEEVLDTVVPGNSREKGHLSASQCGTVYTGSEEEREGSLPDNSSKILQKVRSKSSVTNFSEMTCPSNYSEGSRSWSCCVEVSETTDNGSEAGYEFQLPVSTSGNNTSEKVAIPRRTHLDSDSPSACGGNICEENILNLNVSTLGVANGDNFGGLEVVHKKIDFPHSDSTCGGARTAMVRNRGKETEGCERTEEVRFDSFVQL